MSPKELEELAEAIAHAMRDIDGLSGSARNLGGIFGDMRGAASRSTKAFDDQADSVEKLTEAQQSAYYREMELQRAQEKTLQQSISSVSSFSRALLSSETNLSKYGSTITEGTNALGTMVSTMGKWGPLAEIVIKGFGVLANSALAYSDKLLKTSDELGKLGAAGTMTTEEIRKLAAQGKFTTDTMDSWTKGIKALGPSVIALGGTVTDGVKSFAKLTELSRAQINHYQALGYSQEELVAAQAESIDYYSKSGTVITDQMKNSGRLKEMTLDYMTNLSQLSALTGKNRDELKKERDVATANLAVQTKLADMDRKRRELEAKGDTAGAKKIYEQMEGAKNALTAAQAAGASQSDMIAMSKAFSTGQAVSSKEGGAMVVGGGQNLLEQFVRMGNGTATNRDMRGVQYDYANYIDKAQQKFSHYLPYANEEQAAKVGLSTKAMSESRKYIKSDPEIQKAIKESEVKPEGETAAEGDSTQKGRFISNEATNAAQTFKDGVISFIGPMKLAVLGFGASVAMFGLSVAKSLGGLGNIAGSLGKVGPILTSAASKVGPILTSGASKAAGRLAGPLAVATAAYEGYNTATEGWSKANEDVASGKISRSEGAYKKSQAVGEGAGTAVGGGLGGWGGAAAGAAIGSVVPVVGTAIGALIGGALGAWGGGALGGAVGKALGKSVVQPGRELPKAAEGGTFSGPKSGYPVMLHGEETVIPEKKPLSTGIGTDKLFRDSVTLLEKFNIQIYDATEHLEALNGKLGKLGKGGSSGSGSKKTGPRMPEDAHSVEEAKRLGAANPQKKLGVAESVSLGGGIKPGGGEPGLKLGGGEPGLKIPQGDYLGKIAAQFESGGKAGIISSGKGDFGGKSYGAFQLSSKTGDVDKFLKSSGYGEQFKGEAVGSAGFDAKWKELAKDPKFMEAQAAHAKKTHYDPQMEKLKKGGIDLSGKGRSVQEAVMSTANQYGANTDMVKRALEGQDFNKMSDQQIVNAIQDYKAKTIATKFKSSSPEIQAGVAKRIEQERASLYALDGKPGAQKTSEKQQPSYLATAAPNVNTSKNNMMTNSPTAQLAAQNAAPAAIPQKDTGFLDAISSLGDRLSSHFEKLIDHTADGNDNIKKLQKNMA